MNEAVNQGGVNVAVDDRGLATVEFFHPLSNSLPGKVLAKLANTITELGENDAVKLILVKSAGERAFCAGASFDELIAIEDLDTGKVFFSGFANVINAMRKCPKLIIGRVQGKAVGGGVGLASSVDYCYATKHAAVKLSELAVGIGPFVVGPAVERKLGLAGMSDLAINATEWRSAEWAFQRGLYNDIFEDAAAMDEAIEALAGRLLTKSVLQRCAGSKRIFWEGTEHWDELLAERAAVSGELILSKEAKDAIGAFKSKALRTLFLAVLLMPLALLGQSDTAVAGYHRQAIYSVSGAFTEVDNWNAGGENSSNVSFLLRENWTNKGINFTTVLLEGNYGLSRQTGTLTKNADRLEFTTTLTGSPKTTEWNLSSQFNVRTQLAPGYAKGDTSMRTHFLAPIYGQFSFGVGNTPSTIGSYRRSPESRLQF